MHLTYAKMLAIVMRENMKLGDNTLNNERLTFVNTKFLPKYWRIVALILLPYNISIILKLKGHIERFSLDCRKTKTKVNTLANQRA